MTQTLNFKIIVIDTPLNANNIAALAHTPFMQRPWQCHAHIEILICDLNGHDSVMLKAHILCVQLIDTHFDLMPANHRRRRHWGGMMRRRHWGGMMRRRHWGGMMRRRHWGGMMRRRCRTRTGMMRRRCRTGMMAGTSFVMTGLGTTITTKCTALRLLTMHGTIMSATLRRNALGRCRQWKDKKEYCKTNQPNV
ncbi:MAG: hypothetical protein IKY83_03005 [Proteobacteria bacterium]|nr:hypothetical protein [Pseudomonadota bacterium]